MYQRVLGVDFLDALPEETEPTVDDEGFNEDILDLGSEE